MSDEEIISSSESGSDDDDDEIYPVGGAGKSKKKPVKFMENDEDDDVDSEMSGDDKNEDESEVESENGGDEDDSLDGDVYNENEEDARKMLNRNLGNISGEDSDDDDSDDEDDENEDEYFRKFDEKLKTNVISEYHPEMLQHNYEEIEALTTITYVDGVINDPLHQTVPILTKYEKARILGERAKQINSGAKPFVAVDETVIDGYLIALKELEEKKIPFIIRRPLPNGASEYWKLKDLEML